MSDRRTILGVSFLSGSAAAAVEAGLRGGLVVVPSAPVLVDMADRPALREAITKADLAITDSGLMVLLWWLLRREKLERVSGLEYLKLLLQKLRPETGDSRPEISEKNINLVNRASGFISDTQVSGFKSQVSHAGGVFWIMPAVAARDQNLAWLRSQGFETTAEDCYVAPQYGAGELQDETLAALLHHRRPAHIIIALGGGVQERLGFALKRSLEKTESGKLKAENEGMRNESDAPGFRFQVSGLAGPYRPGIHCIGAAIGFLSGEQVRIPMWVDYLYLGWLWRSVSAPSKFVPRYWKATRLIGLILRYREKAPVRW